MVARKIVWNIVSVAVGLLIGLWLFLTCFLWETDKTPQAFDRCVVPRVLAVGAVILLIGAVAVLRIRIRIRIRKRGDGR